MTNYVKIAKNVGNLDYLLLTGDKKPRARGSGNQLLAKMPQGQKNSP